MQGQHNGLSNIRVIQPHMKSYLFHDQHCFLPMGFPAQRPVDDIGEAW